MPEITITNDDTNVKVKIIKGDSDNPFIPDNFSILLPHSDYKSKTTELLDTDEDKERYMVISSNDPTLDNEEDTDKENTKI